jgi:hypothetical protein
MTRSQQCHKKPSLYKPSCESLLCIAYFICKGKIRLHAGENEGRTLPSHKSVCINVSISFLQECHGIHAPLLLETDIYHNDVVGVLWGADVTLDEGDLRRDD